MRTYLWHWLGRPLPLDFANTIARAGTEEVELLRAPWDLEEWARREQDRARSLPPRCAGDCPVAAARRMVEIRRLRDAVPTLLLAAVDGLPPPRSSTDRLMAAMAGGPTPLDALLAQVARSTLDASRREDLGFCDAPGCGHFFERTRKNQRWCSPACGNRARVARRAGR